MVMLHSYVCLPEGKYWGFLIIIIGFTQLHRNVREDLEIEKMMSPPGNMAKVNSWYVAYGF
jgi:hypothetical protein